MENRNAESERVINTHTKLIYTTYTTRTENKKKQVRRKRMERKISDVDTFFYICITTRKETL